MTSKPKTIRSIARERSAMPEQPAEERVRNFFEVALGYGMELAVREADRCLDCADARCLKGCPVAVDIPGFLRKVSQQDFRGAYDVLARTNVLPAICGRVCPQEDQCEGVCTVGELLEPVAIGRVERWLGDLAIELGWSTPRCVESNGFRVGIVGSGPAGIACAADLARAGCDVTIFEALHAPGGVLRYGIPEFRLPKQVIDAEIDKLSELGVKIECNTLVGRLFTIEQMIDELGFHAVFVATGAGLPKFMRIPGEALNGVVSANELLTRCNLMQAGSFPNFDTPLGLGRRVAVIGSGNTAMDALRVALRCGAERVMCVYRRSRAECPARAEELHHAEQEGVEFHWLADPVAILDDGAGKVRGLRCNRMQLAEPDASGRRRPEVVPDSEFELEADTVIYAIGTNANPIIGQTSGLALNRWGYIDTDANLQTSLAGVYAGGDIVTGSATVILAMGAGRRAARSIARYLGIAEPDAAQPDAFGLDADRHNFVRLRARPRDAATQTPGLDALVPAALRPRLDIDALRPAFPLVLLREPASEQDPACSLRELFDAALRTHAAEVEQDPAFERDALRLEARMRVLAQTPEQARPYQALSLIADAATRELLAAAHTPEQRERLVRIYGLLATGLPNASIATCTTHGARQLLAHLRTQLNRPRNQALRAELGALQAQLATLARADFMTSELAWTAEQLAAAVGPCQRGDFDFAALSRLLTPRRAERALPPPRSARIQELQAALARPNVLGLGPSAWIFERCDAAIEALEQRVTELHELLALLERAHLETRTESGAAAHSPRAWSASTADVFALLPAALVMLDADRLDDAEQSRLFELLASGFPITLLCTSSSLAAATRPAPLAGHAGVPGGRAARLAALARGLGNVYVVQAALSDVPRCLPEIARALEVAGPALIALYTGEDHPRLPSYLAAAAARAARLFPTLTYEPGAAHVDTTHNPEPETCWPQAPFRSEQAGLQRQQTDEAFTAAHVLSTLASYAPYARVVAAEAWNEHMVPLADAWSAPDLSCEPYVTLADQAGQLFRVVVSGPLVEETRRVAEYWLGLSRQAHPQPILEPRTVPEPAPTASASPAAPSGTGVWIESARCSTCDECVRRSPRMFQYDADRRAVVRDARAGSYREIVEAAEHCKLAIIHPGAPWDENEPDLAELRQRAAAFA